MTAWWFEEERVSEEIPSQVEQVPQDGQGVQGAQGAQVYTHSDHLPIVEEDNKVSVDSPELNNRDIWEALLALARAVTTQANLSMVPRVNVEESTMTSTLRELERLNPPNFLGS